MARHARSRISRRFGHFVSPSPVRQYQKNRRSIIEPPASTRRNPISSSPTGRTNSLHVLLPALPAPHLASNHSDETAISSRTFFHDTYACGNSRIPLDAYNFNIVISRLCDAGRLDEALHLQTLFQRLGGASNVVMFTTLLDTY